MFPTSPLPGLTIFWDPLELDPNDIPEADDRDFFDGIEADYAATEPEDLYDEDLPEFDHEPTETPEPRV